MSLLLCGEVAQKSSSNPALLGALIGGGQSVLLAH